MTWHSGQHAGQIQRQPATAGSRMGLLWGLLASGLLGGLLSGSVGCSTMAGSSLWKSPMNSGLLWGNREERISASRQISRNGSEWAGRGASPQAIAAFQDAIRIWPADVRNYLELANQYTLQAEHMSATETLQTGLRYDQNNVELRLKLAESLLMQGFGDAAREQVEAVLQVDRQLAAAWFLRARIHYQQGRYEEALADAYQAEARQDSGDELLELLCQIYFAQGRPSRAWSMVQRLNSRYPAGQRPAKLLALEAEALYQMNRKSEALQSVQQWYHAGGDQDPQCCVLLARFHQELMGEEQENGGGAGPFAWLPLAEKIAATAHPGWGQDSHEQATPLAALYPIQERPKFRPLAQADTETWSLLR